MKSFASDNNAGIHPSVLEAIAQANTGHAVAYGEDSHTRQAELLFRRHFGDKSKVFFMFNGTGANTTAIKSLLRSYQAVICAQSAHINVDECGAPEAASGCKLLTIATKDGKLSPALILPLLLTPHEEHHVQPKMISISQPTELGTVYTQQELTALTQLCQEYRLYLHIDGARLANAAAFLGCSLQEAAGKCHVLSFGGTKNGMMLGEAVVFFDENLANSFKYYRKQNAQLYSKMRFISAQFNAYLSNELWLKNAQNANSQACYLNEQLNKLQMRTLFPPNANAVFVYLPKAAVPLIRDRYFFYFWDEEAMLARLMTAFDTEKSDVDEFVEFLSHCIKS